MARYHVGKYSELLKEHDRYEQKDLHKCSLDKALTDGMDSVDGDIAKAKKAWLSLLCPAQYLMIDKDAC